MRGTQGQYHNGNLLNWQKRSVSLFFEMLCTYNIMFINKNCVDIGPISTNIMGIQPNGM